jgi:protein SCO1/2
MADLTRRRWAAGAALLALAFASAFTAGCDRAPGGGPAYKAIDVSGADFGRELALPDTDGRIRTLADYRGKLTVIFFGYAQCPDVCPTTLAELAQARRALGPAGQDVQGVFVTVDPERDSPEMLKAYVESFDESFVALRGSPDQTREAAKAFKIFYAKVPGKTAESYTVDHTAGAYILDREGRLRLFTRHGTGAEALVHDLKLLLGGA